MKSALCWIFAGWAGIEIACIFLILYAGWTFNQELFLVAMTAPVVTCWVPKLLEN